MAEALIKLVDSFSFGKNDKSLSSIDLVRNLRSDDDSIRPGLEKFYLVLKCGVDPAGDVAKLGLQSWNESQIQEVCALASAIAFASRSLSGTFPRFVFSIKNRFRMFLFLITRGKFKQFFFFENLKLFLKPRLLSFEVDSY